MDNSIKNELNQLLKNNKKWPIILEGGKNLTLNDFKNATILSATVHSSELGVIFDLKGPVLPEWVKQIEAKANDKTNLLVISDLDKQDKKNQEKFKQLLDQKGLNGYPLPQNLQIVVLISSGNRAKINKEILSLCLYYKVD